MNSININQIEKSNVLDILTSNQFAVLEGIDLENVFTDFLTIAPEFLNSYEKTYRTDHKFVRDFSFAEIQDLERRPRNSLMNIYTKYQAAAEIFFNKVFHELIKDKNELIGQFEKKLDCSLMPAYYFNCRAGTHLTPPHTDYGFFTFISGLHCHGLEILVNDKTVKIEMNPNKIVVINGALIEWITNHKLKTTPHRVIGQGEEIRMTYPFFVRPPMDMNMILKSHEPNSTIQFQLFCEKQKLIDQFNSYPFID